MEELHFLYFKSYEVFVAVNHIKFVFLSHLV
jgi:hypothetical protein